MKKFYCDKCKSEVNETDTGWVEISPHYRRGDSYFEKVLQLCPECIRKLKKYLLIVGD